MRPIIIIVGNCQASFIGNFLKGVPEVGQQFEIRRFRNYVVGLDEDTSGASPDKLPSFIRNNKARIAAFLRQATHNWISDPITKESFSPHTVVVDYPAALTSYLWPLVCRDERFDAAPALVRQRYPYTLHDSLLRKLMQEGVPENGIVDAYMAHDITAMFRLDRLKKLHDAKMRQIDERSSFPISDYVEANLTKSQLFRTLNHPTGPFMAEITRRIVDRLPFATDRQALDYRLRMAAAGPGIQDFDAPIHPAIVRHFGLGWAAADKFRFWDEGFYSFAESLVRLYRMECNLKAGEALSLQKNGDLLAARNVLEAAVAEVPRSAKYLMRLAELDLLLGDPRKSLAALRQAWQIEQSLEVGLKLTRVMLFNREMDEAEAMIAELGERFGHDTAEIGIMKGNIMLAAGNKQGAAEWFRALTTSPATHDYRVWLAHSAALSRKQDIKGAYDAMSKAHTLSGMVPSIGRKLDALAKRV